VRDERRGRFEILLYATLRLQRAYKRKRMERENQRRKAEGKRTFEAVLRIQVFIGHVDRLCPIVSVVHSHMCCLGVATFRSGSMAATSSAWPGSSSGCER
jgi:hypothetical protein